GSPRGDRRRGDPSRVTGKALRRADRRERTVMRTAGDQPSVNVLLRADPFVHYTIKSTVNGYSNCNLAWVHQMGVEPGRVGSPNYTSPQAWTGRNQEDNAAMDVVTVTNFPNRNPYFNAYWCPFEANDMRQITLSNGANYMFTA